jgi:hypothetical protein
MVRHLQAISFGVILFALLPAIVAQDDPIADPFSPEENPVAAQPATVAVPRGVVRSKTALGPAEARAKIEDALEIMVDIDFVDTPLSEVAETISSEFDIPVVLDLPGLDLMGMSEDDPINFSVSGVKLRTALDLIYHQLDLSYQIQDEVYVITSQEAAWEQLSTRVYEITRFVAEDPQGMETVVRTRKLPSTSPKIDDVLTMIEDNIHPDSWFNMGGSGSMSVVTAPNDRCLITVTQTEECHYELVQLFKKLDAVIGQTQIAPADAQRNIVRIYPILENVVTAEQARELLEALEAIQWNEPAFIKVIGSTLVIKQTAAVHAQISKVLDNLGALPGER